MVSGIVATLVRFGRGLGASTNLSDQFPWGLWIGFDILVGVGLAAGGFVIAATVNIFQMKRYEVIARPAILTAFLGYLLVIVALMFDLGRPYRIWHPLVMGNPHSVMFEVAMCVMLYTLVLALEFSPLILARLGWHKPVKIIHAAYIPLVIAGVLLSTLHQSSLGTLYIIVPDKLHGLWYTPILPVFFFLSAVAGGLAMTIFESFMSFRAFGRRLESDLLDGIARVIVVVLSVLLIWKLGNLMRRGALPLVFEVTPESVMFWGEMCLGVILPIILFATPKIRASQSGLLLGAVLVVMGFIVNRLNVAITGFIGSSGVNYVPSWMEFAVTAAIVAVGFALFNLAVKHLDVFPPEREVSVSAPAEGAHLARPIWRLEPLLSLWVLLGIGFVILAFAQWRNGTAAAGAADPAAQRTVALDERLELVDGIRFPLGEDSPGVVVFDHSSHVDESDPSCATCHAGAFAITHERAGQTAMTMEEMAEGKYCGVCHDGENAFSSEDDCEFCHEMD
jgi:c(7)-type cytochrome triheme protein